ncbi:MAG: TadE/TadG family type IV pilus assembly protein [Rubricella sp.]
MTRRALIEAHLRAFWKDEHGGTIEFVILFPVLFSAMFSVFELGWLLSKAALLDRGMELAMRDVRLGVPSVMTEAGIRRRICEGAVIFDQCEDWLVVEMTPITGPNDFPQADAACFDRSEDVRPVVTFNPGGRSELIYVRACALTDPIMPTSAIAMGLKEDNDGEYRIITYSAFMNEPE